jgi:hypothetical protein
MKLNSPLPQTLPKECTKAASICMISFHTIIFIFHLYIVRSFVDNGNNGLDGVIPRYVLENAKGFAIFTIFKAGFIFSARAGSGIVIAKLDNGCMSFEFSSQISPQPHFQHGLLQAPLELQAWEWVDRPGLR